MLSRANVRECQDIKKIYLYKIHYPSDKELGEICMQECEDHYVECISGCGNSDCYLDCGRVLSYCQDGQ